MQVYILTESQGCIYEGVSTEIKGVYYDRESTIFEIRQSLPNAEDDGENTSWNFPDHTYTESRGSNVHTFDIEVWKVT